MSPFSSKDGPKGTTLLYVSPFTYWYHFFVQSGSYLLRLCVSPFFRYTPSPLLSSSVLSSHLPLSSLSLDHRGGLESDLMYRSNLTGLVRHEWTYPNKTLTDNGKDILGEFTLQPCPGGNRWSNRDRGLFYRPCINYGSLINRLLPYPPTHSLTETFLFLFLVVSFKRKEKICVLLLQVDSTPQSLIKP